MNSPEENRNPLSSP